MPKPSPPRLLSSDVWMLAAIHLATNAGSKPVPLTHILKAADLLNHATPDYEELRGGLARLDRAGWIVRSPGELTFRCSAAALARFRAIDPPRRTLYDQWKALEVALDAVPWAPNQTAPAVEPDDGYAALTREVHTAALDEYCKHASRGRRRSRG